jgi:hypothetical protein
VVVAIDNDEVDPLDDDDELLAEVEFATVPPDALVD